MSSARKVLLLALLATVAVRCSTWAQDVGNIYTVNCANCHGADGRGNTVLGRTLKLHDLRSPEVRRLKEDELLAIVSKGAQIVAECPEVGICFTQVATTCCVVRRNWIRATTRCRHSLSQADTPLPGFEKKLGIATVRTLVAYVRNMKTSPYPFHRSRKRRAQKPVPTMGMLKVSIPQSVPTVTVRTEREILS